MKRMQEQRERSLLSGREPCLGMLFVAALVMLRDSCAYTGEEWKARAEKRGCSTIPESNMETYCSNTQAKIEELCKTEETRACKSTETFVDNFKRLAEQLSRTPDSDTAEKARLKNEVSAYETRMQNEKALYKRWSENWKECAALRTEIERTFSDAVKLAEYDGSRESSARAPTSQLIDTWIQGNKAHEEERQKAEANKNFCDEQLNRIP